MPNLEVILSKLRDSKYFILIDSCNGYWKAPLDTESQEYRSKLTPDEVITSTRVLHGQTNAVSYFQSTMQLLTKETQDDPPICIDDISGHSDTIAGLFFLLRQFLGVREKHKLNLHAKTYVFFKNNWCNVEEK